MQLVAYGAQDIYLTGNPQITFFKVVYRRHTNFSMEAIEQTWNGTSSGSAGRCTATISRNGDLVHRMYIEVSGTGRMASANVNNIGSALINTVELEIGGQKIDKHTGAWMETWAELTEPNSSGHTASIIAGVNPGNGTLFQNMSGYGGVEATADIDVSINVPLQFWFCRNVGLALPLIALQYHEVKVILEHTIATVFSNAVTKHKLWCDYIYLDTDERRRFAQVSHEYLIEQVQEETLTAGASSTDLNFNHPVKELIFCKDATDGTLVTIGTAGDTAATYQLKLNGHDRFAARNFKYFTRTQVWQYHSGPGGILGVDGAHDGGRLNDGIGVYSFALKPEEHQPSGTCNFSRIDNAQFVGGTSACLATKIYAVNYNVLRIMSGMGGLAYSN